MAEIKTEGIVIRRRDYSKTSQVVHFFTRDIGRLEAIAKGARRKKNNFEGIFDLLYVDDLVLIQKDPSKLAIVTEASVLEDNSAIRNDMRKMYAAVHIIDVVRYFTNYNETHHNQYEMTLKTLDGIGRSNDIRAMVAHYDIKTLVYSGFMPGFDICVRCSMPISHKGKRTFDTVSTGLICEECSKENEDALTEISGETVSVLNTLSKCSFGLIDRLKISPKSHEELFEVIRAMFNSILGYEMITLRYVFHLFKTYRKRKDFLLSLNC